MVAITANAPFANQQSAAVGFTGSLCTRSWLPRELAAKGISRQQYDLLTPLTFVSSVHGAIEVPAGFTTDFASIPRFAWRYIAPDDPCIEYASVVHDYLYSMQGALPDGRTLTRAEADGVLAEAMALCGARWDQQHVVYAAVRLGGATHWSE